MSDRIPAEQTYYTPLTAAGDNTISPRMRRGGQGVWLQGLLVLLIYTMSQIALARADSPREFTIEAQPLDSALKAFALQAQREIFFTPDLTHGKKTRGISGKFQDLDALKAILDGTGLTYSITASKAILVRDAVAPMASSSGERGSNDGPNIEHIRGPALLAQADQNSQTSGPTGPEQNIPDSSDKSSQKAAPLQEVVVTGSRIARPAEERLQPTTVVDSEYIEKRSYTNAIEALQEVPGFGAPGSSLNGPQNTFGAGQSFANYFSLGSQRTLTLVNGRRFVSEDSPTLFNGTGQGGEQVDLNVIPTLLIDRIETIAVGGAPIYGSDAIAGTVNIILKHDFEGLIVNAQGGNAGEGGDQQTQLRALAGKNFLDSRANVTLSLEYSKGGGLLGAERPFYSNDFGYLQTTSGPYKYALFNNARWGGVSFPGVPTVADAYLPTNPQGLGISNAAGQLLSFNNGSLAPWTLGPLSGDNLNTIGGDGLDFGGTQTTLVSPNKRINAVVLGDFKVNDNMRLFGEAWLSDTNVSVTTAQGYYDTSAFGIFPAGTVNGNLIVSANNPFLSAADQATIAQNLAAKGAPGQNTFFLSRENREAGAGGALTTQLTHRAVLGMDGSVPIFGRDFQYNVSAEYGWSTSVSDLPIINFQNLTNALNAVPGPNGQIICAPGYTNSPATTASNTCAPFNPFGLGLASPAALAYVTNQDIASSTLTQRDIVATMNGDLFSLPAGAVKASIGYESRRESANFLPSPSIQASNQYFVATSPIEGDFHTNEEFAELLIPVISPQLDVPFVHRIEIEGAAREVDHSVAGKALTWTAGLRFEPVSSVQLRGNFTRAIRAPSVTEAFLPRSQAYQGATDPCDAANLHSGADPAARAANCAKAGLPPGFVSNADSTTIPYITGGNPNLTNEVASSTTYGALFRPLERMSLSVDYVRINISQAIVALNPTNVLDECYDDPNYPNSACGNITRSTDPKTAGDLTLVKAGFANVGFYNFNGITTQFDYSFDVPFAKTPRGLGTLELKINHFFSNRLDQAVGTAAPTRFAGTLDNSKHTATIDLNWSRDKVYSLWRTQVVGKASFDPTQLATNSQIQGVGTWWVHNLTLGYGGDTGLKLQFVVNNVFNRQPPFPVPAIPGDINLYSNGTNTYFSGIVGRYFIAQVGYRF